MTQYNPIVIIDGILQELPSGDTIDTGVDLSALPDSQVIGWANDPQGFSRESADEVLFTGDSFRVTTSFSTPEITSLGSEVRVVPANGILELSDGINGPTEFQIYNDRDIINGSEWAALGWQETASTFTIGTYAQGTGIDHSIVIESAKNLTLSSTIFTAFTVGAVTTMLITGSSVSFTGVIQPTADNTYDIGQLANAFKDGYFGGTLYSSGIEVSDGTLPTGVVVYNTKDPAENEWAWLTWDSVANKFMIQTLMDGTGSARDMLIKSSGHLEFGADTGYQIYVSPSGVRRWRFRSAGQLEPQITDTVDLGSPTILVRRAYISQYLVTPKIQGRKEATTDPTTTEFSTSTDWGIHKNTASGALFLSANDGGTIKKVRLSENDIQEVSGNTTLTGSTICFVDASSGAVTITLPSNALGLRITVKKIDSSVNAVTISGTIDGASKSLTAQYDAIEIASTSSAWYII